ncbi:hypothetical protein [Actinopolymorpha alba]|uniref:hypothetical protein n=1 Tax=Actinopolymorpha alba TaxID=533267 RepID=UPI00146A829A|nr:hypothetical protein [Actinopolymorpha alba]
MASIRTGRRHLLQHLYIVSSALPDQLDRRDTSIRRRMMPEQPNKRLHDNPYLRGMKALTVGFAILGAITYLANPGSALGTSLLAASGTLLAAWLVVSALLWKPPG